MPSNHRNISFSPTVFNEFRCRSGYTLRASSSRPRAIIYSTLRLMRPNSSAYRWQTFEVIKICAAAGRTVRPHPPRDWVHDGPAGGRRREACIAPASELVDGKAGDVSVRFDDAFTQKRRPWRRFRKRVLASIHAQTKYEATAWAGGGVIVSAARYRYVGVIAGGDKVSDNDRNAVNPLLHSFRRSSSPS